MIGISLAYCVPDIASGKVPIHDVENIIAGTSCKDQEGWDALIASYRATYWCDDNPDECERVLFALLAENKILQPRLKNGRIPTMRGGRMHWATEESAIVWTR